MNAQELQQLLQSQGALQGGPATPFRVVNDLARMPGGRKKLAGVDALYQDLMTLGRYELEQLEESGDRQQPEIADAEVMDGYAGMPENPKEELLKLQEIRENLKTKENPVLAAFIKAAPESKKSVTVPRETGQKRERSE